MNECFYILTIVNNATLNIRVLISFWISTFIFFELIPRSEIARSYGSSVFNFLRNLPTAFHSEHTNYTLTNSIRGFSFFHILPTLVFVFLMMNFLTDVRWYLTMVLMFLLLMISNSEHLFMYLLTIRMSLKNISLQSLCPLFNWIV